MKIRFTKKAHRVILQCIRDDGSYDITNINQGTAYHDLAHYIVETELKLSKGFWGNINSGMTIEQLSTKEVIMQLSEESYLAEIVTRGLQSLHNGACTEGMFLQLINEELEKHGMQARLSLTPQQLSAMHQAYNDVVTQWNEMAEGATLALDWADKKN